MVRQISFPIYKSYTEIIELDKTRASGKRTGGGGGSIFSSTSTSAMPNELAELVAPQQTISKLVLSTKTSLNAASQDYDKLTDPSAQLPSAPVHAARLNGLLKSLANAEGAVAESIKARALLIQSLEKILGSNQATLLAEEAQLVQLGTRKVEIDGRKKDVEDSIMRGFASNSDPSTPAGPVGSPGTIQSPTTLVPEPGRPEVEALTPPVYAQPPPREPAPELNLDASNGNGTYTGPSTQEIQPFAAVTDLLANLSPANSYGNSLPRSTSFASTSSAKKRKLNGGDDFPDLGGDDAMDGLDADVIGMLRQESGDGV